VDDWQRPPPRRENGQVLPGALNLLGKVLGGRREPPRFRGDSTPGVASSPDVVAQAGFDLVELLIEKKQAEASVGERGSRLRRGNGRFSRGDRTGKRRCLWLAPLTLPSSAMSPNGMSLDEFLPTDNNLR
jgi:hypothetical protein